MPLTVSTRINVTLDQIGRVGAPVEVRVKDRHNALSVWIFDEDVIVRTHLADLLGHDSPTLHMRAARRRAVRPLRGTRWPSVGPRPPGRLSRSRSGVATLGPVSEPQSLASVMPGAPKRPSWIIPTVVALAAIALAGVGGTIWFASRSAELTPAAAITTPAAPATTAAGPARDVIALEVCAAIDPSRTSDIAAMKAIGAKAMTSKDTSIRLWGTSLRDSAELAEAAVGAPDARTMEESMIESANHLMQSCRTFGYV